MRGIRELNFPAFHEAQKILESAGHKVFSPAEKDIERYGQDISKGNDSGSVEQAVEEHGFSLRAALGDDLVWICKNADAIALLRGWEASNGAQAEWATARALGLQFIYLT